MKILFVTTQLPNSVTDGIFAGLRDLGIDVVEYPYKPTYHCLNKNNKLMIKGANGDIIAEGKEDEIRVPFGRFGEKSLWGGYIIENNKRRHSSPPSSLNEIDIKQYDYFLIADIRADTFDIISELVKKAPDKIVFLDGGDDPFIKTILYKSKFYFKREKIRKEVANSHFFEQYWFRRIGIVWHDYFYYTPKNILKCIGKPSLFLPLPQTSVLSDRLISTNVTIIPRKEIKFKKTDKKYDLAMIMSIGFNPVRKKFAEYLRGFCQKNGLKSYISTSGSVPWSDYSRIMHESKICISLPAVAYDTHRYWEIPFLGSVIASPTLPLEINNNFKDMESAIFFDSIGEFEMKVKKVLDDGSWDVIGKRAKEHFTKYHTQKKRAEKIMNVLKE